MFLFVLTGNKYDDDDDDDIDIANLSVRLSVRPSRFCIIKLE